MAWSILIVLIFKRVQCNECSYESFVCPSFHLSHPTPPPPSLAPEGAAARDDRLPVQYRRERGRPLQGETGGRTAKCMLHFSCTLSYNTF